jgi:cyclopropane fatty-acyl-phospholipid synthase-like methyltransferase
MRDADSVTTAYDRIAPLWRDDRMSRASEFRERGLVNRLTVSLSPAARILDVGCGCGEPIAAYLVRRGFSLVGVDGSERMLAFAQRAVPEAEFVLGDMRIVEPAGPFDAIVAWDSVFHLPRSDHAVLFARFHAWLRPLGRLLVSLGGSDEEAFTSQMHGETFFYSGYDPHEALQVLENAGFHIEHWEVGDPSSRGHLAVLAVRAA